MVEWIVASIGLGVTIGIFTYQTWKKKQVESAQLTLELGKRFNDEDLKATREKIYDSIDEKRTLRILRPNETTGANEISVGSREMNDYLNELEQIGLFVNKKVLDEKFAYEMFGYQFISVYNHEAVNAFIKEEQKEQSDLYSQFTKAVIRFNEIKIKENPDRMVKKY